MKNFLNLLKNFFKQSWLYVVIFACFVLFDQLTKLFFEGKQIGVISGVFSFTSSHNTGAGFGVLSGKLWLLLMFTFLFLIFLAVFNHYQKHKTKLYKWSMMLIVSGAVGNLIDRLIFGYVRDFLYFELINFPIFNIADSMLTIGVILLIVFLLFVEPKLSKQQKDNVDMQDKNNVDMQDKNLKNE